MISHWKLFVIAVMGVCVLMAAHALPCTASPQEKSAVVVVVANRLLLEDIDSPELPSIARMMKDGAVGLISPNCIGWKSSEAIMLTAGTGVSCRGGAFVRHFFDAGEILKDGSTAGREFALRTGRDARPGSAVFLGLPEAIRANVESSVRPIRFGALGEAIRSAGRKTCVIGNSDITPHSFDRSVAVLAMDSDGLVDTGRLAANFEGPDDCGVCGLVPDAGKLAGAVVESLETAQFVVVDFGYIGKLYDFQASLSEAAAASHKKAIFRELDKLVGKLMTSARQRNNVLVLASFGPPEPEVGRRLTPIVIYGAGRGVLSSPTTRTRGLVAATDFSPTVLTALGIDSDGTITGRGAVVMPASNEQMDIVREVDARVAAHRKLIWPVMWVIVFTGAAALFGAGLLMSVPRLSSVRGLGVAVRLAMLASSALLLAMLLGVLAPPGPLMYGISAIAYLVTLVAVAVAVRPYARRINMPALPVLIIFAITALTILVDAATGGHLVKYTLAASYQISGLRYYGIGNEYAAALISMSAITVLFLSMRVRQWAWLIGVTAAVAVVFLGLGRLGANYGGTVAAVVTFALLLISMKRGAFGARHVLAALALGIVLVVGLAVAESKLAGSGISHAGRMKNLVEVFGGAYLLAVLKRKVMINFGLMFHPRAFNAYAAFLPLLFFWLYNIRGRLHATVAKDKRMMAGIKAITVGSITALVLNDSGIIMGGIMLSMLVVVLIYSLLDENNAASPQIALPAEESGCQGS